MTIRCLSSRRRPVATAVIALLLAGGAACGGDRADPTPTSGVQVGIGAGPSTGAGDGGGGDGGAGQGSTTSGEGAGSGDGGTGPGSGGSSAEGPGAGSGGGPAICIPAPGPLGSLAIETVLAGTCGAPGGTAVDVAAVGEVPGFFDRMVTVGTSRVAGGEESNSGPIWLDEDGANPDAESFFPGGTGLAVRGDEVAILGDQLTVQRFDASRSEVGSPVIVGEFDGGAQGIAGHGDGWLVAWLSGGDVVARRTDGALAGLEEPQIVEGSAFSEFGSLAVRGGGTATAIAYAGETGGDWRLGLVIATSEYAEPVDLACGDEPIRVVDVEALEDGWLVLTRNRDSDTSYLVRADAAGLPVPPAIELAGAATPFGLRRNGDAVAVVAELATGEPALRTFDAATLAPLGGWVCLATAGATGWPIALDVDGDGFAALSANEAEGLRMTRTDATGEGP